MIQGKWLKGRDDLEQAFKIRLKVFVEEQNVPEEIEIDEIDPIADHALVYDGDKPAATGRVYQEQGIYMVGRIAVLKEYRGKGLGDLVTRMLLCRAFDMGAQEVHIHAQLQALKFYEKLNFKAYGEIYDEAGIEHTSMVIHRDDAVWYNDPCS